MFPCGVCQREVSWSHKAVACDNCDVWHHKSCASLNSAEFDTIENHSWRCHCCRSVNLSSFLYKAYNLNVSNSFDPLAGIPGDDSIFLSEIASPTTKFEPNTASSPKPTPSNKKSSTESYPSSSRSSLNASHAQSSILPPPPDKRNNIRIGTLNANSIKGKRAELAELINFTQMDVIIISETKLPSQEEAKRIEHPVKPSEILPKDFDGTIHRPRSINGGGVMVAVRKNLVAEEVPLKAGKNGEVVCAKIHLQNNAPNSSDQM